MTLEHEAKRIADGLEGLIEVMLTLLGYVDDTAVERLSSMLKSNLGASVSTAKATQMTRKDLFTEIRKREAIGNNAKTEVLVTKYAAILDREARESRSAAFVDQKEAIEKSQETPEPAPEPPAEEPPAEEFTWLTSMPEYLAATRANCEIYFAAHGAKTFGERLHEINPDKAKISTFSLDELQDLFWRINQDPAVKNELAAQAKEAKSGK